MDIGASQPRTGSASQSASEFERLVPNSTGSFASSAAASREPGSHGGLGSPGSERPGQDRDRPNQKRSGGKLPPWLRMSLIILLKTIRILLVPALCVGALLVGLTIGYSIIGDGDATDVLKLSTWKHLYDLVFQGT